MEKQPELLHQYSENFYPNNRLSIVDLTTNQKSLSVKQLRGQNRYALFPKFYAAIPVDQYRKYAIMTCGVNGCHLSSL
jgi:hypothetical protein